jgi:hypothetical protein
MIPYLLMATAFGIVAVLLLIFVGRYAERGAKLAHADDTIIALKERLDAALAEQARLTTRVENLEAIVTGEAWEAFQQGGLLEEPPVEIPEEPSNEEKATQMARRQRS